MEDLKRIPTWALVEELKTRKEDIRFSKGINYTIITIKNNESEEN